MYAILLSWRYLRTRYIALASIVSVTLGVATLVVVNSVMSGFAHEMHVRLHSILSDVVLESYGMSGFPDPEWHVAEIRKELGDDLVAISASVHVPAMLTLKYNGESINRQVTIVGVDEDSYARVGDFSQYLVHPENRQSLSFDLQEGGYGDTSHPDLRGAGWGYRRQLGRWNKAVIDQIRSEREAQRQLEERLKASTNDTEPPLEGSTDDLDPIDVNQSGDKDENKADVPNDDGTATNEVAQVSASIEVPIESSIPSEKSTQSPPRFNDPFAKARTADQFENIFDMEKEQRTGVILGIAISLVPQRDRSGKVKNIYLTAPGDDVILSFPTAGQEPKIVSEKFTVVDFYESKMSEYDSSFAIVPISELQRLRLMIDPVTKSKSVTTIQMKLKPGADINAIRDRLRERFPADQFPFRIQTWRDMQGPLLAAVQMETTLLNLLLFLIIAVAGFGILATFFMIVVEKTKDIGVLKALGAPNRGVMSIFLTYGFSLGLVGAGVGLILGLLFVVNINQIAKGLEYLTGREVFDPTIYYFSKIPTIVEPFTLTWVVAGSVIIAVMASVLPALRAARLHPVEALRYE